MGGFNVRKIILAFFFFFFFKSTNKNGLLADQSISYILTGAGVVNETDLFDSFYNG